MPEITEEVVSPRYSYNDVRIMSTTITITIKAMICFVTIITITMICLLYCVLKQQREISLAQVANQRDTRLAERNAALQQPQPLPDPSSTRTER
jgi:hypothetical protein